MHIIVLVANFTLYMLYRRHCLSVKLHFSEVLVESDIKQLDKD